MRESNDTSNATDTFNAGQCAVLERVALGAPLPQLLADIVRFIEAQAPGMLCSIVLLDADRRCIRDGVAPSLPSEFLGALNGLAIGPNAGSCGVAAYRGERVIVTDIATHPNWADYRDLALPHGLRACWSSPIQSTNDEVLGTFAMYYREPRAPTAQEKLWVDVATHLASIAILRDRAEQSLRHSEARARQLARLYEVSNGINEAIVRTRDPQSLYDFACRIAVEQGLARLAWIGLCKAAQDRVLPVARFGNDSAYVDSIQLSLADDRMKNGPAGRALRTGHPATSNDIANDEEFFWKEAALQRDLRSCAVFPLKIGDRCIGVFALYAEKSNYFQEEELRVLTTLAADISFAVESAHNERERRRMEDSVRAGEMLRALIYTNVEDCIFYLAIEGEDRYRFLSVNPAFLKATGLTENQVVGKSLHDVVPEPSLTMVLKQYRLAIARREKISWEETTRYPSGVRHGEVTLCPVFDATGRCTNLVGTVHDITARKRADEERLHLESQLHQSQRLQSLGTLVGGIAHDFNNILAAIACNVDLALLDAPAGSPLQENLSQVQKASRRAIDLVRQILTFSRRSTPKREAVDPRRVVDEALQLLRATLPSNVEIKTDFAADVAKISADATQLHQIVMNLGVNAAQAMNGRAGTIAVNLARYRVDAASNSAPPELEEGAYVRLTIADTGCGMDELVLQRAFDPFFTTKAPGEGTGLGLSVVDGIVKNHNGAIDVRSEIGRGTTFNIYFPEAANVSIESRTATVITAHGERVLYVDDEEALTFLATRALSRLGYRVTGYSSSLTALQEFRARPNDFDVVVTDVSMPGLSGPELAREMRLARPDVPIVMLSGYIRPEDVEAAERLHIKQLVYKPSTIAELGEILAREIGALQA